MLRKLGAGVLIVLIFLPFTAPFPTFDIAALSNHSVTGYAAVVCPISALVATVDVAGTLVPPLLTKSGRLRIDVTPQIDSAIVAVTPSRSIRPPLQVSPSHQSSLIKLRL
jgi:hypothetical protein